MPTKIATASFTRPANTTAYTAGDLVANSTTAGSVVVPSVTAVVTGDRGGMVRRVRMSKSGTGITAAAFRLHLYGAEPTPDAGDNGAWLTDQAAAYLGSIDITVDKAFTDGAVGVGVPAEGSEINYGGDHIWWLLEARDTYGPASAEVFTVDFELLPN